MSSRQIRHVDARTKVIWSRVTASAIVFATTLSVESWTGQLGAIDAATLHAKQSKVMITMETFDPQSLSTAAFAD